MDLRTERITRSKELRAVAVEKGQAFLTPRGTPPTTEPVKSKRTYTRKTQEVPTCSQPSR
jgi:hypothetical protein